MALGKVYLLRHEKRQNNVSFSSPLTDEGLYDAKHVVTPHLENLDIGTIYCSPFIRTLQTIKPYCDKNNKKVNLEWSLVESLPLNPKIPEKYSSIINHEYKSLLPYSYPGDNSIIDFEILQNRVKQFIESLDRTENVLLVTHMPVINAILASRGFEWIEMYSHHQPGCLLSMSGTYI